VLQTLLLRSQMQMVLGNEQAGLADALKALELAEPERFISVFVEEGTPVAETLRTLLKRNLPGSVPEYIRDILAAFPGTQADKQAALPAHDAGNADEALIQPLTPRELEVLQHIAAGDSNQIIADKLVITLSAVKKHTGNIFKKLNVSNRTQAVLRGRKLGLLA
jgi:LuxR family maltose regulon positive regulatory protein